MIRISRGQEPTIPIFQTSVLSFESGAMTTNRFARLSRNSTIAAQEHRFFSMIVSSLCSILAQYPSINIKPSSLSGWPVRDLIAEDIIIRHDRLDDPWINGCVFSVHLSLLLQGFGGHIFHWPHFSWCRYNKTIRYGMNYHDLVHFTPASLSHSNKVIEVTLMFIPFHPSG